ncbi:hypothetical protein J6590_062135 [Homalodisca vitripennis]|nr:hypothetical protein J6590_062135 [Homalodisca vitripennis]
MPNTHNAVVRTTLSSIARHGCGATGNPRVSHSIRYVIETTLQTVVSHRPVDEIRHTSLLHAKSLERDADAATLAPTLAGRHSLPSPWQPGTPTSFPPPAFRVLMHLLLLILSELDLTSKRIVYSFLIVPIQLGL